MINMEMVKIPKDEYEKLKIKPIGINPKYAPAYLVAAARESWNEALMMGERYGYRNAQVTVIAPTGTIGLVMDCDTTGIEPDFALVKFKKLDGGGYFKIINQSVPAALKKQGYAPSQIQDIVNHTKGYGTLKNAPFVHHEALKKKGFTDEALEKLEAARRNRLPSRSIKHVVVRIESFGGGSRFATVKDFMETIDFKIPSGFTENLNDKFDILIYYRPDGADIGFVLEPKDHERAFAHMLEWEDSIILDFRNLYFDADVTQPLHLFSDAIVRNIDIRSVNLQENITFSYGIFAQRFLVIATSDEFMDVLLGRLLAAPPR